MEVQLTRPKRQQLVEERPAQRFPDLPEPKVKPVVQEEVRESVDSYEEIMVSPMTPPESPGVRKTDLMVQMLAQLGLQDMDRQADPKIEQTQPAPEPIPANEYKINFLCLSDKEAEVDDIFASPLCAVKLTESGSIASVQQQINFTVTETSTQGSFEIVFKPTAEIDSPERRLLITYTAFQNLHQILATEYFYLVHPILPQEGIFDKLFWSTKLANEQSTELQFYLNQLMSIDEVRSSKTFQLFFTDPTAFSEYHKEWLQKVGQQQSPGFVQTLKKWFGGIYGLLQNQKLDVFQKEKQQIEGFYRFLKRQLDSNQALADSVTNHLEYSSQISQIGIMAYPNRKGTRASDLMSSNTNRDHLINFRAASLDQLIRAIKSLLREVLACDEAIMRANQAFVNYHKLKEATPKDRMYEEVHGDLDLHEAYIKLGKLQGPLGEDLRKHIIGIRAQIKALFGDSYRQLLRNLTYQF